MNAIDNATKGLFRIKFWGTRGTRHVPGKEFTGYGTNTICLEVQCGERVIVFDAGSGIVGLGTDLASRGVKKIDLFLSHAHYDHVEGIPFFEPFYDPGFSAILWSGRLKGVSKTRDIVDRLMCEPFFPISQEKFLAKIRYHEINDHQNIDMLDGISIETFRLHHPGGATAYRIQYAGKSFAFVTDTSHFAGQLDTKLSLFLKNCDAFAYDCSYLDEEFPQFEHYGHSTWEEAQRLLTASGAKQVFGLHHMPFRTDAALYDIEQKIIKMDNCTISKDGMVVTL